MVSRISLLNILQDAGIEFESYFHFLCLAFRKVNRLTYHSKVIDILICKHFCTRGKLEGSDRNLTKRQDLLVKTQDGAAVARNLEILNLKGLRRTWCESFHFLHKRNPFLNYKAFHGDVTLTNYQFYIQRPKDSSDAYRISIVNNLYTTDNVFSI